jgi:hypothetical protein
MSAVNNDKCFLTNFFPTCQNILSSINQKISSFVSDIFHLKSEPKNSYDILSDEFNSKKFTLDGTLSTNITERLSRLKDKFEKLKNNEEMLSNLKTNYNEKIDNYTVIKLTGAVIGTKRSIELLEKEIKNLINKNTVDATHKKMQQVLFPKEFVKGMDQAKFFDESELTEKEKAYLAKLPAAANSPKTKLDFQLNEVLSTEWVLSESLKKSLKLMDVLIEKTADSMTSAEHDELMVIREHYKQAYSSSAKFYRQLINIVQDNSKQGSLLIVQAEKKEEPSRISNLISYFSSIKLPFGAPKPVGDTLKVPQRPQVHTPNSQNPVVKISDLYKSADFREYADALKTCTIDHKSNKLQHAEKLYDGVKIHPKLELNGASFASLAVTPVQRMVRHELLLRDIHSGLIPKDGGQQSNQERFVTVNIKSAFEHVQKMNQAINAELGKV